jgi:hypothetical protein
MLLFTFIWTQKQEAKWNAGSRDLLEKLTVFSLFKKSSTFYRAPCSQDPLTGPYSDMSHINPVRSLTTSLCRIHFNIILSTSPIQHSQYSDWLRSERPRGRISSPGRVKNFLFSKSSRLSLGSIQRPTKWVPGALSPGGIALGAWNWPLTAI